MLNEIVDLYNLKEDGDWTGWTNVEASGVASLCNRQPYQLKFTPEGIDTYSWFSGLFGINLQLSTDSFILFLQQELKNYTNNVYNIEYITDDKTGELYITIKLTDGTYIKEGFNNVI